MEKQAKPFLKWAGGKRQLINNLIKHIPNNYNRYIEPFIGGGALFFHLQPKEAVISDSNEELINTYKIVRDEVQNLIELLSQYPHDKSFYYEIRAKDTSTLTPLLRATRFIYLNKTCYNGLYRVNKKGEFNVPFGSQKNPTICDKDTLLLASATLKNTIIKHGDYHKILEKYAHSGDFVYLDPPYDPVGKHSDFKRYTKEFFYEDDQVKLANHYGELVAKDVFCLLTNSNTAMIRELYEAYPYEIINTKRNINSKGSKRNNGEDIIVFMTAPPKRSKKRMVAKQSSNLIESFPGTRFMGSKFNILEFIDQTLDGIQFNSVLDAFSGSGCVSYYFKKKGKQVFSNDLLSFSYHMTNALVENNIEILTDDDLCMLLEPTANSPTFIQDTFSGLYFTDNENKFLDQTRSNIDKLSSEYKRSLALSALVRACLKKRPRGIFTYVGDRYNDNRLDMRRSLREHFLIAVQEFRDAVFDNKQKNFAYNCDIFDLDIKPDLVYCDPPYYSPHADSDYLRRYHFVEGLVKYWDGIKIQQHTKTKKFKKYPTDFDGKDATYKAFLRLFEKFQDSIIVVSYSSTALPSKSELVEMIKQFKRQVIVYQIDHRYSFGTQYKNAKRNKVAEYLFIGV